ncbi:hypothetical protein Tco_1110008 [Tanacetum coccineum]|uniref:SPK domain-containing protein n=1 Tax=Tanacetum coccineum TaxID=301880 RepID=A0ABQ5IHK7_9ASTR
MNNVFQKKESIQYPCFIKLIIADLMKKFPRIPQRIDEDYHSIKDDIPLVSVYTTRNVLVRGMLISNAFMTEEIHATDDFKEYKTVFVGGKKRKQIVRKSSSPRKSLKITIRKKKQSTTLIPPPVQEKLDEGEIENMVQGEENEESHASVFADSLINDDFDDFGTKIESGSHKEHPENVTNDDEEIEKEMKDKEIEKEKNIDMKEKMQTPIPSPTRSPRKVSSFDKTVSEELTATGTTKNCYYNQCISTSKRKKRHSYKTKIFRKMIAGHVQTPWSNSFSYIKTKFVTHEFFMGKIREVLNHCNNAVPEMMFAKTNEMIKEEIPHLVNLAVNKDREVDPINAQEMISKEFATHAPKMIEELFRKHMQHRTLNLYPTTSSSTADLQQQLYLNMKSKPQDQAADPELWKILKAKFEKQ